MRKLVIVPLVAFGLALGSCEKRSQCDAQQDCGISKTDTCMKNVSKEDLAGISKALDLYVQAAVEGDSKIARPAFIEGATISHVENDSIICLPIKALFDYYDQTGKHPASYEIAECNVANDVAMVRIESEFGDTRFSDIFTLAKEGTVWKIVSKIFTVK